MSAAGIWLFLLSIHSLKFGRCWGNFQSHFLFFFFNGIIGGAHCPNCVSKWDGTGRGVQRTKRDGPHAQEDRWSDSTSVIHWGKGMVKRFVSEASNLVSFIFLSQPTRDMRVSLPVPIIISFSSSWLSKCIRFCVALLASSDPCPHPLANTHRWV